MKRIALAAFLLASAAWPAQAQFRVVSTCGSVAPFGSQPAGGLAYPTIDANGRVCITGALASGAAAPLFVMASLANCPSGAPAAQCVQSPYTYAAPSNLKYLEAWAWGTGGPGGGGAQQASATACTGGGAGGAGGKAYAVLSPQQIGASLTITAPAGPSGGLGATAISTQGGLTSTASAANTTVANAGGWSIVNAGRGGAGSGGNLASQSYGGGGGLPGVQGTDATQSAAGGSPQGGGAGGAGVASVATIGFGMGSGGGGGAAAGTGTGSGTAAAAPSGGGAGGGISSSSTALAGGTAGQVESLSVTQTNGGAICSNGPTGFTPTWNGTNWASNRALNLFSGSGGGGGGGCTTGVGGAGGPGGFPGGGGGGGGCAQNGNAGGNGGKGGDGLVILIAHY